MEPATQAQKDGWLKKALSPILDRFNMPSGMMSKFMGVLKRVPLLGIGIDIAINKGIAGQDWTESIVRGLFSGGFGAIGAGAGAAAGKVVGAAAGTLLIPVPGLGTAVGMGLGGALGGLIGSMLAGFLGDRVGAMTYEEFSGKTATENPLVTDEQVDSITNTVKGAFSSDDQLSHTHSDKERIPMVASAKTITEGLSTPEGMQMPSGGNTEINVTELPPTITKVPAAGSTAPTSEGDISAPPTLSAIDSEMNMYRSVATKEYQLA